MNYGLYLSASGMMTNLYRQDVFANNLSNAETSGFKPDVPALRHRDPEAVEDQVDLRASKPMREKLGGGVLAAEQRISFGSAKLNKTGNPLDLALTGDKTFFAVQAPAGENNQLEIALTRDGQFTRNQTGELVTQEGRPVLNADDQPIVVPGSAPVRINNGGQIIQNGEVIDRVQVARVENTNALRKRGENLLAIEGPDPRQAAQNPGIKSGFVEASGVDPIPTLSQLISATKSAQGNAKMIKYHDRLRVQAVRTLGRVG